MTASQFIANRRAESGLSLRDFGKVCGVSYQTIANIERGINPRTGKEFVPTLDNIKSIAAGLGIPFDTLLGMFDGSLTTDPNPPAILINNRKLLKLIEAMQDCTNRELDDIAAYIEFVKSRR